MKKTLSVIIGVWLTTVAAFADGDMAPRTHYLMSENLGNIPSPEAAAMVRYGAGLQSLYTGTVSYSIPFFTYTDRDFNIPISFEYSYSGYQPNTAAGPLGPGWTLNAGGAITREVRGIPDEVVQSMQDKCFGAAQANINYPNVKGYAYRHFIDTTITTLYPDCAYSGQAGQEYFLFDWDAGGYANINEYFGYETQPDIFRFNFMGYSGSFVLQPKHKAVFFGTDRPSGEFRLDGLTIVGDRITSIVIRTGDNYVYTFSAQEEAGSPVGIYPDTAEYRVNSWRLTSITAPCGRVASFSYWIRQSYSYLPSKTKDDYYYLPAINWGDELIEESDFPDSYHIYEDMQDISLVTSYSKCLSGIIVDGDTTAVLSYDAGLLSEIVIRNNAGRLIRECSLQYDSTGFLAGMQIPGTGEYGFEYYFTEGVPSGNTWAVDWYGYCSTVVNYGNFLPNYPSGNSNDNARKNYMYNNRRPTFLAARHGALRKVIFPTGGNCVYEYGPNRYGRDMTGITPAGVEKVTSGIRLELARVYDANGRQVQERRYLYEYPDGSPSGNLLWWPVVYNDYSAFSTSFRTLTRTVTSSACDFPFGAGNHIEYLSVYEEVFAPEDTLKKAITRYQYRTSWSNDASDRVIGRETGIKGETESQEYYMWHYSQQGVSPAYWSFELGHSALSSANKDYFLSVMPSGMAGRLHKKTMYSGNRSNPVSYEATEWSSYLSAPPLNCRQILAGFVLTYQHQFHTPYVRTATSVSYDSGTDAREFIRSTTVTALDSLHRTAELQTIGSAGDTVRRAFTYFDKVPGFLASESTFRDGNLTDYKAYTYRKADLEIPAPGPGMYVHVRTDAGIIAPGVSVPSGTYPVMQVDSLDVIGNPLQVRDASGVYTSYIWGYGGQYLVAKVVGADFETATRHLQQVTDIPLQYGLSATDEATLRAMSGVEVTTWTWVPLVGVSSVTQPNGYTTLYDYDSSGRLIRTRDGTGNTLNTYEYHIVTDTEE